MDAKKEMDETKNTNNIDEDDDDEEDDDYVPPEEENDDEEKGSQPNNAIDNDTKNDVLPPEKQAAVDEAFASLFGETTTNHDDTNTNKQSKKLTKNRKNQKKRKKQERLLADIFGGVSVAKKIMFSSINKRRNTRDRDDGENSNKKRKRLFTSSTMVPKEVIRKESKIFAGQTIEVETRSIVVQQGDNNNNNDETINNKAVTRGGIDSVLEQLQKPTKLNTLDKTSSDWDTFKDRNQLKDDLEEKAQGKNAYLIKQDFLTRVDLRQFEKEKTQRDLQRAQANK